MSIINQKVQKSFIEIVKQYKTIANLGKSIINTNKKIKKNPNMDMFQMEQIHVRQREKIEAFEKLTRKTNKDWKRNRLSIQKYWTGID